jgi:hypothetical protein
MRFVAVKSMEKQASGMAFKTRDLLVRRRRRSTRYEGIWQNMGLLPPTAQSASPAWQRQSAAPMSVCQLRSSDCARCCLRILPHLANRLDVTVHLPG